ncbi:uncharacterized protein LOC128650252 isoform X2 [Bombina bombina]|uniref:uncharacterized protein LOC128650252 isoform X2 n=1 Tax=Bombina bombina TaxID=8345 RepID=UPI00235A7B4E|nr:uncharacterized protein LOC128650252 isoform X2 [Bombina bombina]
MQTAGCTRQTCLLHIQVLNDQIQMGCNCCRMLQSSTIHSDEPHSNGYDGYINEGHSYTQSEYEDYKSQTVNELNSKNLKKIDHEIFTHSQDETIISEKKNETPSKALTTDSSPYPNLKFNTNVEVKNYSSETDNPYIDNSSQSLSSATENVFNEEPGLKLTSEELECLKKEKNCLTEKTMLKRQNETYDSINNSDISIVHTDNQQQVEKANGLLPGGLSNHRLDSLITSADACVTRNESLVARIILRNSSRDRKRQSRNKHLIADGHAEDDIDADVAEALAALAAAIAGEDFEDNLA